MDSVGEGESGMIWENGIEPCIISYVKRIASPGSMHDTGCSGLVHWGAVAGKGLILPSGGNHVVFLELRRHSRVTTYKTAKETLMYRSVLWTLWERERVGRIGRMALKHV